MTRRDLSSIRRQLQRWWLAECRSLRAEWETLCSKWTHSFYSGELPACCEPETNYWSCPAITSAATNATRLACLRDKARQATPDRNLQSEPAEFQIPMSRPALRSLQVDRGLARRSRRLRLCDRARPSARRRESA